jgi:hypothetical protein
VRYIVNWQQVTTTFILVIGVFVGVLEGIHLADLLKQKLPSHTRLALEQFARMAAQAQQGVKLSGAAKKQLAIADVSTLFKAFNLPAPQSEAVDIAIEAAVSTLPKLVEPTQTIE